MIFQRLISQAVSSGFSEETIVLLLLLPLVASLVATARHLIGFRGFGIFIPTAIAAALVVTGVVTGLVIFVVTMLTATASRYLLRRVRVHYLPRMALVLWCVSLGILALILGSPYLGLVQLTEISIFPILILVLLTEEFIRVQMGKSLREAARLTAETIVTALAGFAVFSNPLLRSWAINYPHWVAIFPLVLNVLVGKFTGLRLLEYRRFRRILK